MTGLTFIGRATSPSFMVVAPLKPKRIHLAEFSTPEERFIYLKVGSCNKSAAPPGSTSILCISKPLIQRVSTSASYWGTIILFELTVGKDMGSSIGLISSCSPFAWIAFTIALNVAALKRFLCWCFD